MNRGEVWWYEAPGLGRRPHLILTRNAAIPVLQQVLAVPATTTVRGIPTEVPLEVEDGMPRACVLAMDNLALLRRSLFVERICELGAERMRAVCEALRIAVDC